MRHHFFEERDRHARVRDAVFEFAHKHQGRGFGPFAGGFMGARGGGHGLGGGRKLTSADLQIVLLALLAIQPSHGYELIKALEERSGGFYSPSPGMIYPALTYLEEIGHASVEAEGGRKRYSITDAGRAYLDRHRDAADAILAQLERIGAKMGRVRDVFSGEDDDRRDDDRDERGGSGAEVWMALRELKRALRDTRRAGAGEAQRIAAILQRAAADILGGG